MHIPDAYLSPATDAVAYAVLLPLWSVAARKTSRSLSSKQAPLLSIGAAFCFAIQMFNIPALGGTTAHALGATLLAILVGPWAAFMGMTLTLAIQALLFGDGGILSLAANCWDMGVVACFVGHWMYRTLGGASPLGSKRRIWAAGIGAYVGTVVASLSAGILLGIQPLIAHDAAGHPLYNPFGLSIAVPAMVMSHLLIAGPAEAIITIGAVAYLWRAFPEYASAGTRHQVDTGVRIARKMTWVVVLTPIGLIAGGGAWGEWEPGELKAMIGYVPQGIRNLPTLVHPVLPDYGFAGITGGPLQMAGYIASALVGCALVGAFTRGVVRSVNPDVAEELRPGRASQELPTWLRTSSPQSPQGATPNSKRKKWLENTVLKLRAAVEKTIAAETVAHSNGFLQSVHPLAKAIGFLVALVAVGLARSPIALLSLLMLGFAAAAYSKVNIRRFGLRVAETVAFFGIVAIVPILFRGWHSGPHQNGFSTESVLMASTMLCRLAAGISLAVLWNLTTKWYELIGSLRSLGVPRLFLTTATLTYRYLFVVVQSMSEMLEARLARQAGVCEAREGRTYVGHGAAILFAKSQAFADEMHHAMLSRSFENIRYGSSDRKWRLRDSAFVAVGVASLLAASLDIARFL